FNNKSRIESVVSGSKALVVRTENKDDAVVNKLKKAYQSKEVKEFIEKKFDGSVLPSW
ncbi:MetQ/NlpA family ABC transporter substrate-binding protein, partial [Bacillus sp. D-CC]